MVILSISLAFEIHFSKGYSDTNCLFILTITKLLRFVNFFLLFIKVVSQALLITKVKHVACDFFLYCRLFGDVCLTTGVLDKLFGFDIPVWFFS